MAFPVILADSATGSDTAASGAGPSTAITGSTGRTRNTASQLKFGLFGATDSLTDVVTDGSHVVYMAISTAGQRNFSSISAKKDTRHTDIGSITSGTAILSDIVSTSGWTIGDVIKVTGAGAASADLYSTILTVDSAIQVTLNDNAGTTVIGAVVENPKQVTLTTSQGVNTGTTDTSWAIGGKRATWDNANSRKLWENNASSGDAVSGWTITTESDQSLTSVIVLRRSGNADGPIITKGSGTNRPIITQTANAAVFDSNAGGNLQEFEFLEFHNTNATKTAAYGIIVRSNILFKNCIIGNQTNTLFDGINMSNNSQTVMLNNCVIRYCTNTGIYGANNTCSTIASNTHIHNCTSRGIFTRGLNITNCIIRNNGSNGIDNNNGASGYTYISGCIITGNTGAGIKLGGALYGTYVQGNILSQNTYGLELFSTILFDHRLFDYNAFYLNSSGPVLNVSNSDNDIILTANPFLDSANSDFNLNDTAGGGAVLRADTMFLLGHTNTELGVFRSWIDPLPSNGTLFNIIGGS